MLKRLSLLLFCLTLWLTGVVVFAQGLSAELVAQQALKDRGYAIGTVDGIWGPRSTAAMKEFQGTAGLPVTGLPDLVSMEVLTAPAEHSPTSPGPDDAISVTPPPPGSVSQSPARLDPPSELNLGFQPGVSSTPEGSRDLPAVTEPDAALELPAGEVVAPAVPEVVEETDEPDQTVQTSAAAPSPSNTENTEPNFGGFLIALGIPALFVYWFFSRRERRKKESALRSSTRGSSYSILDLADDGPLSPTPNVHTPNAPAPQRDSTRRAEIAAHNAAVDEAIRTRSQTVGQRPRQNDIYAPVTTLPEVDQRDIRIVGALQSALGLTPASRPTPAVSSGRRQTKNSPWIPDGRPVEVGQHRLDRGLVYVGDHLKSQKGWPERDNCLIVPSLPVASRGDVSGQYLDYWPSFETLTPSSRKAYLDWLASDRANPNTPVGYVFLYFYGLERRLMLERSDDDRAAIVAEVERLLRVYGENRSFQRYANELLAAAEIMYNGLGAHQVSRPQLAGGTVPIAVRIEIGRRAALGQSINAELLLSLTVNHPETRIRTPARRLFHLVERRFAERLAMDYPAGLTIALPRNPPKLQPTYRAASNTFEVSIIPESSGFPDVVALPQPLGYGRKLLETITEELDGYSRELGRTGGVATSLASLARLPPDLAREEALTLPGAPLDQLLELAGKHQMVKWADLARIAGVNGEGATKTRLKELALCLRTWNLGIVPDPAFSPKIVADWNDALVFLSSPDEPMPQAPSQHYQMAYISLALGVLVAQSDGEVSDAERTLLSKVILESPGVNGNERRRLVSEARWLEAHP